MPKSHYTSDPALSSMRSYSPKAYNSYEDREFERYDKLGSSRYDALPYNGKERYTKSSDRYSKPLKSDSKYSSFDDKYTKSDSKHSRYDKVESKFETYKKSKYDRYDKDRYENRNAKHDTYRSKDLYPRSLDTSPTSYSRPTSDRMLKSGRYDSDSRSTKRYDSSPKSKLSNFARSEPFKSTKSYADTKRKDYHSTDRPTSHKDYPVPYARKYEDKYPYDDPPYPPTFSRLSPPKRDARKYDSDRPPKKPTFYAAQKLPEFDRPHYDLPLNHNSKYERYVIGDSVVYGSPGHHPDALYSPPRSRSERKIKPKTLSSEKYSPSIGLPEGMQIVDRVDSHAHSPYPSAEKKVRTRRSVSRSPPRKKPRFSSGRDHRSFPAARGRGGRSQKDTYRDRFGSGRLPRPTSPPKPLLSINLSASSIPGLSRHRVKQTLSIGEELPRRRNVPAVRPRRPEDRGRKRPRSPRDTKRRPDDLRLWIESRKSGPSHGSPTKRRFESSRSAKLSAAVEKIRLLESNKRVATKRPLARIVKGKVRPVPRTAAASKSKTGRRDRSQSPGRKNGVKRAPKISPQNSKSKRTKHVSPLKHVTPIKIKQEKSETGIEPGITIKEEVLSPTH